MRKIRKAPAARVWTRPFSPLPSPAKLMGDWGPGYTAANNRASDAGPNFRCSDCGMRQVHGVGSCALCGGDLQRVGGGGGEGSGHAGAGRVGSARRAAAANAPPSEEIQAQAQQILESILPPDLLEGVASGGASQPTDQAVLDELPLEKIEPYVVLKISPDMSSTEPSGATPSRELLADAAERRSRGECSNAHKEASPPAATNPPEADAAPLLELRATASSFGTPLADLPDGVAAPLILACPRDGAADFSNASELKDRIVVMWRGGCSFVDKVRRAQAAGAKAAVVVQSAGQKWPFSMSDTAGKGVDLLLPSLMISPAGGDALLKLMDGGAAADRAEDGNAVDVSDGAAKPVACAPRRLVGTARAHNHQTSCAVCLQEFQAEELAVRLPCSHLFHEDCVRQWLKKHHTCPTCRKPLKASGPDGAAAERERGDAADPSSWFAMPQGTAPMPASGMYT